MIQDIKRSDVSLDDWHRICDAIAGAVRTSENVIDLTPIIVRLMPDFDPQYPEPAKVIRPTFRRERERNVA